MAVYSVATGALAPVLSKLSALLGDEHLDLAERTRSDAMFIRSQLEAVHSLLLPRISWGMTGEEVDALCKDELMAEVRELSYDMDDAIDEFFLEEPMAGGDGGPFDELKTRVEDVSKQFSDSRRWRPPVEQHQPSLTAATVDCPPPHARFVHNMMDVSELVEMDKLHEKELIKLLEQGADTSIYASRWRIATPWHDKEVKTTSFYFFFISTSLFIYYIILYYKNLKCFGCVYFGTSWLSSYRIRSPVQYVMCCTSLASRYIIYLSIPMLFFLSKFQLLIIPHLMRDIYTILFQ